MVKNKTDLRVLKTKRNIKDSFLSLAKDHDLHTITVKQICDLAVCGRNTFYQHYPYKEALLLEIENDIISDIVESFRPMKNFSTGMFDSFSEDYLRLCLSSISKIRDIFPIFPPESEAFSHFVHKLQNQLLQITHQRVVELYGIQTDRKRQTNYIDLHFLISGILSFGVFWITQTSFTLDEAIQAIRPAFIAMSQVCEKNIYETR